MVIFWGLKKIKKTCMMKIFVTLCFEIYDDLDMKSVYTVRQWLCGGWLPKWATARARWATARVRPYVLLSNVLINSALPPPPAKY